MLNAVALGGAGAGLRRRTRVSASAGAGLRQRSESQGAQVRTPGSAGAALKERGQPYVAALEVQGFSGPSICLRHIVPNMMPLIVAQATIMFGWAMVDLAAISFLGLGVQPPAPNWGVMISENQVGVLQGYPLPAISAGVCIVVVVIAFNILGERRFERAQAARA